MISRKQEEKNEKIVRGLLKLPPNRRCINCNALGPQYVCTNFWTFVCVICSGIHREFTHRVKSVSMSKFTTQEVEALQRGGNQRAKEIFLVGWDMQNQRLPNSSNAEKIREFIKMVYIEKKYARGMSSDRPPRDMQNLKNFEEDNRKASSYHSYSQSPPYDNQYEERRYGKRSNMLTRRTGSERLDYSAIFRSTVYSPGHTGDQMYEDRFANEGSSPRMSDFSVSSSGETPKYEIGSPISDNLSRDVSRIPNPQRTISSGSILSSHSTSLKSFNSAGMVEGMLMREPPTSTQHKETSIPGSIIRSYGHSHATNQEPSLSPQPSAAASSQLIDLFAETNQSVNTTFSDQNLSKVPFPENKGWATFDIPQHAGSSESTMTPKEQITNVDVGALPSANYAPPLQLEPNPTCGQHVPSTSDQCNLSSHGDKELLAPSNTQFWEAFDHLSAHSTQIPVQRTSSTTTLQTPANSLPTSIDSYVDLRLPEDFSGTKVETGIPNLSMPYYSAATGIPTTSTVIPIMGRDTQAQKSSNPFDLPYEYDFRPDDSFLEMSSLQTALPDQQFPSPFTSNVSQALFAQNQAPQYISPVVSDDLAYMAGQQPGPQFPSLPLQNQVASLGGNPFA